MKLNLKNRYSNVKRKLKYYMISKNRTCINIGCGNDIRKGWINCDINPTNNIIKKIDIKNKSDLEWLVNLKTDIIECNHVIGYLNYIQVKNFLITCFKSLNNKGILIIEFPDIIKICKLLIEHDTNETKPDSYIELIRGIYAFDLDDAYNEFFEKKTYVFGWNSKIILNILKHILSILLIMANINFYYIED